MENLLSAIMVAIMVVVVLTLLMASLVVAVYTVNMYFGIWQSIALVVAGLGTCAIIHRLINNWLLS